MSLNPKFKYCRDGHHSPVDVQTCVQDGTINVAAVCSVCNAELEIDARISDMDAVYDDADCCAKCDEGRPHCKCDEFVAKKDEQEVE